MRLKKRLIILAVTFLLILANTAFFSSSQSLDDYYHEFKRINKVNPTIEVQFQEEIELKNATLYGINNALMEKNDYFFQQFQVTGDISFLYSMQAMLIPIDTAISGTTVIVTPQMPLSNGYYILELNVVDLIGNQAVHYEYLQLNITETDIRIIEPRLGVSNTPVNNLTIMTIRNNVAERTECKIGVDNPYYNYDNLALKPFETPSVMRSTHTVGNVFNMFGLGSSGQFYIVCIDETLGRVNQKKFDVYVDTIPPVISSISFIPPKVVEFPETGENLSAYIVVNANEPVICRYSFNEDKNYTDMTDFSSFNLFDFDAYKTQPRQKHVLPPELKASYMFYVQCEDRAGWRSNKKTGRLDVDLSAGLGISVVLPPKYTTNRTIELTAKTNKRASCQIKGEDIGQYTDMIMLPDMKIHKYALGTLTDGSYTYSIYCRSTAAGIIQDQTYSYSFVIDNTRPLVPNITGTPVTCYSDRFLFEPPLLLGAKDPESGISHFLIEIRKGSEVILNWTRVDDSISELDGDFEEGTFPLENDTTYALNIKAVNNAGLESTQKKFNLKYDPANEICFEKNPPTVTISENKSTGFTTVEFVCIDDSGCDENKFYYGAGNTSENCTAETKLSGPPFTAEIRESSYVCYHVSDIVGNNASGTEFIEIDEAESCSNMRKDGDETDTDCGGSCSPCELDMHCLDNIDCKSNYCTGDICTKAVCDDGVQNGPLNNEESDVDCGGYCSDLGYRCSLDMFCFVDDDCESSFCNPDEEVCAESTCDDGYKGPGEADVDCGGVCIDEFKLCEIGSACDIDDDCFSGNCIAGTCKETVKLVVEKKFPLGLVFIVLGLIMMAGGIGYLVYKKKFLAPAAPARAEPAAAGPSREEEEKARQRRIAEERRRKAIEEQRKMVLEEKKRRGEAARKKIEELEKRKKEEREKIFGIFGGPKAAPETLEEEIKEEKGGWLSFDMFKNILKPKKEKLEGKVKKGAKAPPAPKPSTIFEALGKIEGEKEEDIYKRLEEIIPKKDRKAAFEELEKIKSGKERDVYKELRKYIKPTKPSKKKGRKKKIKKK